jgi:hypothetical protein
MREGYEPLRGRRRWVVAVFGTIVALCLAAVGLSIAELNLIDRLESGQFVSDEEIAANDRRVQTIGIVQFIAFLAGGIVFIRWLRAAYRNADVLAPGVRRYGHGWAIGAWFVPILNLWRPKQIVNDVWEASTLPGDGRRPPVLLLTWWLSWIASFLLGRAATRATANDETLDDLRATDLLWIVSDGWDAITAVMAVSVVVYLTRRLDRKAAARAAAATDDAAAARGAAATDQAAAATGAAGTDHAAAATGAAATDHAAAATGAAATGDAAGASGAPAAATLSASDAAATDGSPATAAIPGASDAAATDGAPATGDAAATGDAPEAGDAADAAPHAPANAPPMVAPERPTALD